jgi:hypothetical protein
MDPHFFPPFGQGRFLILFSGFGVMLIFCPGNFGRGGTSV